MTITFSLRQLDDRAAKKLGVAIASMDPWRTLRIGPETIARQLLEPEDHLRQHEICLKKECAGAIVVRAPWLYGPYISLLAILPDYQAMGLGAAVLRKVANETKPRPKNIWVCVSSFNQRAQRFYTRNGFEHVGTLPGLIRPKFTELLMRKRLG
jgi:ribosomal protein S18 acetylase RimI-like enzyme